ncbi:hypothetical protein [Shewanella donghaensis]|uniref:hypothetical protein n=1 Tax=Shewanella donghaensis TaxID=238836 RepID=UPI00118278C8|nr:hypothetical protein [Shewanella donghaensis]
MRVFAMSFTQKLVKKRFEIVLELVSVFLAVTLALALNQWNQDRIAQNNANNIFQKLSAELNLNNEKLDDSIKSFESIIKTLELYQKNEEENQNPNTDFNLSHIVITLLSDNIWQLTLKRNSVDYLDIDDANVLFSTYRGQSFIEEQNQRILEFQMRNNTTPKDIAALKQMMIYTLAVTQKTKQLQTDSILLLAKYNEL